MSKPTTGLGRLLREVEVLARVHTPNAIDTLAQICGDKEAPAAARVGAAKALLDRGWGKAPQTVTVDLVSDHLTDADLDRQIMERLSLHAGGDKAPVRH